MNGKTERHIEYGFRYPETRRCTGMWWWKKEIVSPAVVEAMPGRTARDIAWELRMGYQMPAGTEAMSRFIITDDGATVEVGPWQHAYIPPDPPKPKPKVVQTEEWTEHYRERVVY